MAWTNPETFTAGQPLTAASMNVISENTRVLRALANVQSTHKTDSWTSALNLNWQNVTGLAATVTPTATTSKVLVTATVLFGSTVTAGTNVNGRIDRSGVTLPFVAACNVYQQAQWGILQVSYLDSPATTSARTYQFQIVGSNGNTNYTYVNLRGDAAATATSSITVQEIPA